MSQSSPKNAPGTAVSSSNSSSVSAPTRQAIALISIEADPDPDADAGEGRISGQRIHVRQIGETLAKLGWQVDIYTRKTDPNLPTIVEHAPHCRTIRLEVGPLTPLSREQIFEHLPEFIDAFQTFQTKKATIYPLIHTHYWLSGWIGLRLKQENNVLWVHTCHSLATDEYGTLAARPAIAQTRLATEREILTHADRVIVTSPDELCTVQSQVPNCPARLIPGGTDLSTFHRIPKTEARLLLGFDADIPILLYVGRFDTHKGIDTLLEACQCLSQGEIGGYEPFTQFQVVLVGDDAGTASHEREHLEQEIQALGLSEKVHFAGRIRHGRLPLFYTAADVCVVPSQYEPFGLVALEAMACETPVVASDVGGLKFTVIPEETGLLVPVGDAPAFARAIARILSNPQWADTLKTKASSHVQEAFTWTSAGAQVSDLYRRLLAESLMAAPSSNGGSALNGSTARF